MTEFATIDCFGRWGTSVFTENTAIFKKTTRAGVYETLCPQHMLAPNNSLEMIPNLQKAI